MKVSAFVIPVALSAWLHGASALAQTSPVAAGEKTPAVPQPAEPQELLLVAKVNGKTFDEAILALKDPQARLYVAAQDLRLWRLQLPCLKWITVRIPLQRLKLVRVKKKATNFRGLFLFG